MGLGGITEPLSISVFLFENRKDRALQTMKLFIFKALTPAQGYCSVRRRPCLELGPWRPPRAGPGHGATGFLSGVCCLADATRPQDWSCRTNGGTSGGIGSKAPSLCLTEMGTPIPLAPPRTGLPRGQRKGGRERDLKAADNPSPHNLP